MADRASNNSENSEQPELDLLEDEFLKISNPKMIKELLNDSRASRLIFINRENPVRNHNAVHEARHLKSQLKDLVPLTIDFNDKDMLNQIDQIYYQKRIGGVEKTFEEFLSQGDGPPLDYIVISKYNDIIFFQYQKNVDYDPFKKQLDGPAKMDTPGRLVVNSAGDS